MYFYAYAGHRVVIHCAQACAILRFFSLFVPDIRGL